MQRGLRLAALAVVLGAIAWAQHSRADIPFSFHIGEVELSAGEYEIILGQPFHETVMVRSLSNPAAAAAATVFDGKDQDTRTPRAKLVFNRYGQDEYFLSEVWSISWASSAQLLKSQHELVTSRMVAGSQPEKVVIVARVQLP